MTEIKPAFTKTFWFSDDPRYHINKRNRIIILRDKAKRAFVGKEVFSAEVETKNGWSIHFFGIETAERQWISAEEDWPSGWVWTYLPTRY